MKDNIETIEQFNKAMLEHSQAMEQNMESPQCNEMRDDIESMQSLIKDLYPGTLRVITGEQPYGALGTTKVLGKRILAKALTTHFPDVVSVELFANLDLVGSEKRFYQLVVPNVGSPEGLLGYNLLSEKIRGNDTIASGIPLPNEYVTKQVSKALQSFKTYYPGQMPDKKGPRYDSSVMSNWASLYGVETATEDCSPANYSEAHIRWLTKLEDSLGIKTDFQTTEGEIDLQLAKKGGISILNRIWKKGVRELRNEGYSPIGFKVTEDQDDITPFNLSANGIRLRTKFLGCDQSDILIQHPKNPEASHIITIDEALSGKYGFSFRAVPRVILYSLASFSGHITGGGSVYNQDAEHFMENAGLPYFPITNMRPEIGDEKVSCIQYASTALSRIEHRLLQEALRKGEVSLLDFVMSCNLEEARAKILEATNKSTFNLKQYIEVSNKEGRMPSLS